MALTTYAGLLAAVPLWTNRSDLTSIIPDFVAVFEAQLNARLAEAGISGRLARATATIDNEYELQPTGFAGPISLTIDGEVVENVTLDSLLSMATLQGEEAAQPRYFSIVGSEFRFYPVPDTGYVGDLTFYQRVPALSVSTTTNWVLEEYPNLYLYGTLLQSAPYLMDDDRTGLWAQFVESGITDLIKAERAKRGSRNTPGYRTDLPRRPFFDINTGL